MPRISPFKRQRVIEIKRAGVSNRSIAREITISQFSVAILVNVSTLVSNSMTDQKVNYLFEMLTGWWWNQKDIQRKQQTN